MTGVFAVLALFLVLLATDDATEKTSAKIPAVPPFLWLLTLAVLCGYAAWRLR